MRASTRLSHMLATYTAFSGSRGVLSFSTFFSFFLLLLNVAPRHSSLSIMRGLSSLSSCRARTGPPPRRAASDRCRASRPRTPRTPRRQFPCTWRGIWIRQMHIPRTTLRRISGCGWQRRCQTPRTGRTRSRPHRGDCARTASWSSWPTETHQSGLGIETDVSRLRLTLSRILEVPLFANIRLAKLRADP